MSHASRFSKILPEGARAAPLPTKPDPRLAKIAAVLALAQPKVPRKILWLRLLGYWSLTLACAALAFAIHHVVARLVFGSASVVLFILGIPLRYWQISSDD